MSLLLTPLGSKTWNMYILEESSSLIPLQYNVKHFPWILYLFCYILQQSLLTIQQVGKKNLYLMSFLPQNVHGAHHLHQ